MNPELQRNLWLEASRRQLAGAGLIVGLIFAAVWVIDRGRSAYDVVIAGALVFFVCALVWGPREARGAVVHEVYARTWDFQRLSALSPWTMTWGKLLGATSRTWAFAGLALLVAFLQLASVSSTAHAVYWALIALGAAVVLQASGLAVGLIEVRKARAAARPPGLRSPGLIGLFLALVAGGSLIWARQHAVWTADIGEGALTSSARPVIWWNYPYDPSAFAAWSLVVFGAWAVAWAWRMMRLELQFENAAWAWPAFVLFASLYAAGFSGLTEEPVTVLETRLASAGATSALLAYLGAFLDPADRVQARQFAADLAGGRLARLGDRTPLILAPTLLCAVAVGWSALVHLHAQDGPGAVFLLALLAFLVRDLGVIAALRFAPRGRGADFMALAGLALLYVLGGGLGRLFAGPVGGALFLPSPAFAATSLTAGLGEAVLAWTLAAVRIAQPAQRSLRPPRR